MAVPPAAALTARLAAPVADAALPAPPISTAVVIAVLGAAVLHAAWNALAHGTDDRLVGFALIGTAHTAGGAAVVLVAGAPPAGAWPFIAVSALLHCLYTLLLLASYQLGEFSQMYPLARGTSPWVVALVAAVGLGQELPPAQLAGVLVVSAGLASLALLGGRDRAPAAPEPAGHAAAGPGGPVRGPALRRPGVMALAAAFGTGLMIASYTIVDGVGVHHAPVTAYAGWLFLLQGPPIALLAVVRRGRGLASLSPGSAATGLTGGVLSLAAYGIVLWAQTRGALAPIAALRETSIVIGAAIGAVFLDERLGFRRAVAGAVVVTGIALINLR